MTSPAPLRVMQVVLSLDPGGTERLVIQIVKMLERDVISTVCCLDAPGAWAAELADNGADVVALGRRPGFRPALGCKIAQIAAARSVDLLHCHHYSPFVYGQIAAIANRRLRVVFTEHGRLSDTPPSLKRRIVNPILGRLPAAIVAVSADLKRHMVAEGLPEARVSVIHNGIVCGPRPTAADRIAARQALGLRSDQLVIGTAGRLDRVKDLSTLFDAARAVADAHPDLHVVIVGDGPDRARLEQHARALGIDRRVTFAGYRKDARALLPALDVYVNSSVHEGVSLTVLEAMAAGLPIVATRAGGTPEVIANEETGLLVQPREPKQLASAIQRLLASDDRRRDLGAAARVRVEREFTIDVMMARYLSAYHRAKES